MKYFKLYTEWAVSHSVFSRLGKLFKNEMSQKSGKSPIRGAGGTAKNQNVDYFKIRGEGVADFQINKID